MYVGKPKDGEPASAYLPPLFGLLARGTKRSGLSKASTERKRWKYRYMLIEFRDGTPY